MENFTKKPINYNLILFVVILIAASFFYLYKLGFSDLWSDEIYTKSMLDGSFSVFLANFKNDLHPPLYYLSLRLFTVIFGASAITLRLFSVMGAISTLLVGYFAGQRIFGQKGALYFCLVIISIPMLAAYSHQARMYTWASFSVTGIFIYAYLYLKTEKNRDLMLLFVFTFIAMYLHYYSMAAAFVANLFVFIYLVATKSKKWLPHLWSMVLAALFFLPWLFMFIVQVKKVQHAFWAPEVSLNGVLACFGIPFTEQFWTSNYAFALTVLVYSLIVIAIIMGFKKSFAEHRLSIWLSLVVFIGTLLVATLVSLFSQPILSPRYVMSIVTMLAVPPAILFIHIKIEWLKMLLITAILMLGIRVSVSNYGFSYGPYKQTIEHVTSTYPAIKKMVHITEITAGPLVEYSKNTGLGHYWIKAEMSNVDAFTEIHQYTKAGEFLQVGEEFCAVRFHNLELNIENLERVLFESELIKIDTIRDHKMTDGIFIQLYLLKYKGIQNTQQKPE